MPSAPGGQLAGGCQSSVSDHSPPLQAGLSSVLLNCARITGLLERLMKAVDTISLRGGKTL